MVIYKVLRNKIQFITHPKAWEWLTRNTVGEIKNLRYANETILLAENEKEIKVRRHCLGVPSPKLN